MRSSDVAEVRLVLASASPARLTTLRRAGIEPIVSVSGVDESVTEETSPTRLAAVLAELKGRAVAQRTTPPETGRLLVLGCDSVLDVDGRAHGKPGTPAMARERLAVLSGRSAVLHTGHHLTDLASGEEVSAVASTLVRFARLEPAEIAAYVDTGEPLAVAGAFTVDGLGGAFVEAVEGDPHNVVGLSLPLLRTMVAGLGIRWPQLWNFRNSGQAS